MYHSQRVKALELNVGSKNVDVAIAYTKHCHFSPRVMIFQVWSNSLQTEDNETVSGKHMLLQTVFFDIANLQRETSTLPPLHPCHPAAPPDMLGAISATLIPLGNSHRQRPSYFHMTIFISPLLPLRTRSIGRVSHDIGISYTSTHDLVSSVLHQPSRPMSASVSTPMSLPTPPSRNLPTPPQVTTPQPPGHSRNSHDNDRLQIHHLLSQRNRKTPTCCM